MINLIRVNSCLFVVLRGFLPHETEKVFWSLFLAIRWPWRNQKSFFENGGQLPAISCSQMPGNPVRIGDGCATVTDYEFPKATVCPAMRDGPEGGNEVKSEVRIPVWLCSSG